MTNPDRPCRTRKPAIWSLGVLLLALTFSTGCEDKVLSPETDASLTSTPRTPPGTPPTLPPIPPVSPPAPVTPGVSANPFASARFYVKPGSNAEKQAAQWRATRPADAAQMDKIAAQPVAWWLGEWSGDVGAEVREVMNDHAAAGTLPVFVVYNIPNRDCGGYSAGGLTAAGYSSWNRAIADAIGTRKAVILLEPDAVPDIDCMSAAGQNERFAALVDAVNIYKSKPAITVYIDAGHPGWQDAPTMAAWLKRAGVDKADGFVLNVSYFASNAKNATYGASISQLIGGKHFVIDTSRNGLGEGSTWCNPTGRALGMSATANTGNPLIDAYYWVKAPGESDGECGGGPAAGNWWSSYALGLAQRTTDAMLGR